MEPGTLERIIIRVLVTSKLPTAPPDAHCLSPAPPNTHCLPLTPPDTPVVGLMS